MPPPRRVEDRRERRGGPARGDAARAVAESPWHLLRRLFGLLPSVLVAAAAMVVVGGVLWWALDTGRLVVSAADPTPDGRNGPLAFSGALGVALLLGLVAAWFGPLSWLTRTGARRTLGAVAPGWSGRDRPGDARARGDRRARRAARHRAADQLVAVRRSARAAVGAPAGRFGTLTGSRAAHVARRRASLAQSARAPVL